MREIVYSFVLYFNYFIVIYVIIFAIWQITQIIGTLFIVYSNKRKDNLLRQEDFSKSATQVPISIIIPAYNEEVVIIGSVKNILNLDYPNYEVIIVNDGSTDETLSKLIVEWNLKKIHYPVEKRVPCSTIRGVYRNVSYPNLTVIDKENGAKKADACNAGINISRYPYFMNIDSDSLLEQDSLYWISRSLMKNKNCVAVGGMVRVSNGNTIKDNKVTEFHMPKNWLARFQVVEYLRSFLMGRAFTAKMGCLMVISGAFGAFDKKAVIETGGYSLDNVGEDMDLVMKLHHHMRKNKREYSIVFTPKAICWTQAPEILSDLASQRRRWQIGLFQVMCSFKHMLFNPKYGTVGMIGMPYQFLYELCGPVVEIAGMLVMPLSLYFEIITPYGLLLFTLAGLQLGIIGSLGSLLADVGVFDLPIRFKEFVFMAILSFMDSFSYRYITVWHRFTAILQYRKHSHSWKSITRQSFHDTKE